jgi:hypothetical protein
MSFTRILILLVVLAFTATGCIENLALTSPNDEVGTTFNGLGDWVWVDKNQNGIQDVDESGFPGVLVSLHDCDGNFISSDTTNDLGNYELGGYDSGDYMVHFTLPDGYAFTNMHADSNTTVDSDADPLSGFTTCITLVDTLPEPTIDAGIYPLFSTSALGDWVWLDENRNGLQDDGELGVPDVLVTLTDCDGVWVMADTTETDGSYSFSEVYPGDYQVVFSLPEGHVFTVMHADSNSAVDSDVDPATGATLCLTLADGVMNYDVDAGMYPQALPLGCAHGKGYWKNHLDEVDELLSITLGEEDGEKSLVVSDTDIAYDVLQQHTYGEPSNGITKVYAHLLTAKLSIANGADGSEAEDAIAEADAFLSVHDWNDWDDLSHDDRQLVQRMIGTFHVTSASDDCPDDEEEDE